MGRLLLVEDDPEVAALVQLLFTRAGHEVTHVGDGRSALREAYRHHPDLVVLDIGLPGMDGWQVLARLRELSDVPVLLLSARDRPADKVRGLRAGADDYLAKPFTTGELTARVDALLRRSRRAVAWHTQPYEDGTVRLDPLQHRVHVDGREVELTPTEFRLLHALVRHAGAVLTPVQLLDLAWDDRSAATGKVKYAVLRLRRKLGWTDPEQSPLHAVRGVGYRYQPTR